MRLMNRSILLSSYLIFFFQAEDGIRDTSVTGVQTCALPICPSLEIVQLRELRDVVTMARRNRLLDRGALAQMRQKRLRRRDVLRKTPNAPEERHCRIEAAFWSLWRGEGPELLGDWPRIAHRDGPCRGRVHDQRRLTRDQRLVVARIVPGKDAVRQERHQLLEPFEHLPRRV